MPGNEQDVHPTYQASNSISRSSSVIPLGAESPTRASQRIFCHSEKEELVYRDSSVLTSTHFSSIAGDTRLGGRFINSQIKNSDSNSPSHHNPRALSDEGVDDRRSTGPVLLNLDHRAMLKPSSPPRTHHDAPLTRARARAQALTIHNQTRKSDLSNPSHGCDSQKPKASSNEHKATEPLSCQLPPINSVGQTTRFPGVDGPVDRHSSTGGEGSVSSALKHEFFKSKSDDDEYELPETENNNSESELSDSQEIRVASKKRTNKNPLKTTCSSSPGDKHKGKTRVAPTTTKKIGHQATERATIAIRKPHADLNQIMHSLGLQGTSQGRFSAVHKSVKVTAGIGDQGALGRISDSHDAVKELQGLVSPPKSKSRASNIRRPKRPFYQDNLGEQQARSELVTPTHTNDNAYNPSTLRQQEYDSFSPIKQKQRGAREIQSIAQKQRNTLEMPQSKARQQTSTHVKGKCHTTSLTEHNPIIDTSSNVHSSLIMLSPDQHRKFTRLEHGETASCHSPSSKREAETSNKRHNGPEISNRNVKKIKYASIIGASTIDIDVPTQDHLLPPSAGLEHFSRIPETRNDATQTETSDFQPFPPNHCYQKGPGKDEMGKEIVPRNWWLESPRVRGTYEALRAKPVTTRFTKKCKRSVKSEHLLPKKVPTDSLTTEEPLHATSRAWAQQIAERSRQKNLSPIPLATEEPGAHGQITIKVRKCGKNLVSKREIALGGRRNAVVDSIQEVTAVSYTGTLIFTY
ncbi:hypothetical protein SAMD00023353_0302470 [Rosellinia necatrix]|uniref:Uncharacterized protein n=1 Tax=Rosellinia necatrix TaxID=77044 RepID=A0A1W2TDP6_ROSNE|nr:hypothetical protein SAMD00023353_0302470 [Rosellinia necatrix]